MKVNLKMKITDLYLWKGKILEHCFNEQLMHYDLSTLISQESFYTNSPSKGHG